MEAKDLKLRISDSLEEDVMIGSVMDIEEEENTLGVETLEGDRFFVSVEVV
jgi:hypothetical protein